MNKWILISEKFRVPPLFANSRSATDDIDHDKE